MENVLPFEALVVLLVAFLHPCLTNQVKSSGCIDPIGSQALAKCQPNPALLARPCQPCQPRQPTRPGSARKISAMRGLRMNLEAWGTSMARSVSSSFKRSRPVSSQRPKLATASRSSETNGGGRSPMNRSLVGLGRLEDTVPLRNFRFGESDSMI